MEQISLRLSEEYNAKRKLVRYQPGDVVWLQNMKRQNKFTPHWLGPYRVSEVVHPGTYRIYDAKGNVHGSPITAEHLKRAVFDSEELNLPIVDSSSSSAVADGGEFISASSQASSAATASTSDRLLSSDIPLALSSSSSSSAAHPVLLPRPFVAGDLSGQSPREYNSASDSFEVENITDRKVQRGKVYYQVRWVGYDSASWEPVENLEGCAELIDAFDQSHLQPSDASLREQRVAPGKLRSHFQEVTGQQQRSSFDSSSPRSFSSPSCSSCSASASTSAASFSSLPSSSSSSLSSSDFSPSTSAASSSAASAFSSPAATGLRRSARLHRQHP